MPRASPTGHTFEAEARGIHMFEVPAVDLTDKDLMFTFKHEGKEFSIPFMQYIPLPVLDAAQKRGGIGHIPVLEELGLTEAAAAWRSMSPFQIKKLTEAWTVASAVGMGESGASTSS